MLHTLRIAQDKSLLALLGKAAQKGADLAPEFLYERVKRAAA